MSLEFSDATWAAVEDGIFIPVGDLIGSVASEYASGETEASKQGQFAFSFFKELRNVLSGTSFLATQDSANYLGLTQAKTEAIPTVGLVNHNFSFTIQWVGNKNVGSFVVLPSATTGDNLDGGELVFTDIFPNAVKVSSGGSTGDGGVLIPSSGLVDFGVASHAAIDLAVDSRNLIQAILGYLKDSELTVRTTNTASAITALTETTANVVLPDSAFDATNPTTGLDNTNPNIYIASSETLSFSIQTVTNDDETNSVNAVTA